MSKNKKTMPNKNPFSQPCFLLVLLPSALALSSFITWATLKLIEGTYWYGLNIVLVISGIFIAFLAIIAYTTWRISRRYSRSRQIQQEHARIERLIEKQTQETEIIENIEQDHLHQNKENPL